MAKRNEKRNPSTEQITLPLPVEAKKGQELPHIFRRITAVLKWRVIFALLIIAIFALNMGQIARNLYNRYQYAQVKQAEKQVLENQMYQWETIVKQRPNYRDGYFKLATLAFELDKLDEAKNYLAKVFELDPNFEPAKQLQKALQ